MNQYIVRALGGAIIVAWCSSPVLPQAPSLPRSATSSSPCTTRPESRQLDFWVGEWDVTEKDQAIATSRIERIVDDCVILEKYSQADGYHGTSLNFYDASLARWRQTWIDNLGNVSEFVGTYRDDAMHFEGETHRNDGRRIMRRMTIRKLGPDRVRQTSQQSLDAGKTWATAYDFVYRRRS